MSIYLHCLPLYSKTGPWESAGCLCHVWAPGNTGSSPQTLYSLPYNSFLLPESPYTHFSSAIVMLIVQKHWRNNWLSNTDGLHSKLKPFILLFKSRGAVQKWGQLLRGFSRHGMTPPLLHISICFLILSRKRVNTMIHKHTHRLLGQHCAVAMSCCFSVMSH